MSNRAFRTYIISITFLLVISFPTVNHYFHFVTDLTSFENRAIAKEPDFDINYLDPFPVKCDSFYNDHFTLRNRLIRYFNIYKVLAFRKSPTSAVVIGNHDRLFFAGGEMDSYMGKNRLNDHELQAYKQELEFRQSYLQQKGIKFYFMVVPCKASIYSEDIGYEYFRIFEESWGEHLNSFLREHSFVKPIEIFSALRKFKTEHDLYYKLDNHWNDIGAFHAANQVFQRMKFDFPSIETLSLSDYEIVKPKNPSGDLDEMLGKLNIFSESSLELHPKKAFKAHEGEKAGYPIPSTFAYPKSYEQVREINGSKKPKILIVCDSFGNRIFPFISENFSKTVKLFDAWRYEFHQDIVDQEKPDAILLMIYESHLRSLIDHAEHISKK